MENPEFNPTQPLTESGYSEAQQAKQREGIALDKSQLAQQQSQQPVRKRQKSKTRREKLSISSSARRDI